MFNYIEHGRGSGYIWKYAFYMATCFDCGWIMPEPSSACWFCDYDPNVESNHTATNCCNNVAIVSFNDIHSAFEQMHIQDGTKRGK